MKHLLVCLLMLLAVPAAAQVSTSKTVTITVTAPSGGVCSAPPAAPAVAAGFTTPVLCSDFTTQMPANWLGGCAVAGNGAQTNPFDTTGHNWYLNIWWSNTAQNCIVVQRADPALGGLTLDMPWVANSNQQQFGTTLQSAAWLSTDTTDGNQGVTIPNNFYVEIVMRQTPIAQGAYAALFTWPLLAMTQGSTGQAGNELDVIEEDSGNLNNSDSAFHNWLLNNFGPWVWQGICGQGAVPQGLPCGFDPTQYHTFSSISQSDGINNHVCSYVDGVLLMCQPSPGGFTAVQAVARYFLIVQNACDWWNYASNFCNTGSNQHMYVRSVKAWSCPTWQTTQCNSTSGGGSPNGPNQLSRTWVNSNATQAVTVAPDATTPALKITQDTSAPINHGVIQTITSTTGASTFGLNIAPGSGSGATSLQMLVCSGAGLSPCSDGVGAFFNPTNGTLIKTATGGANDLFLGAGTTAIAGSCPPAPNCGFHVWFSYSMPASAQVTALAATGAQATGDGTSSTLMWNWALETGTNAPTDGIGPVSAGIASIDFSNVDPNDGNLHAASGVANAEVSRMWVTMIPFYPVASTATWSISGANSCGLTLSATTGLGVALQAPGGGVAAQTCTNTTVNVTVGASSLSKTPTIVFHSGTVAACGSGSTIQTAINSAGAGGTVLLQSCTYSQQTFTTQNNQRLQGSGSALTILDGTGNASTMTDGNGGATGVTIDSVGVTGYANIGTTNCSLGAANSFTIRTNDGWTIENSKFNASSCDAVNGNWGTGTTRVLNTAIVNPQRNGLFCGPNQAGETGTFTFQGNEISGANQGDYTGAVAAGVKCFSPDNAVESTVNVLNNYIHDGFPSTGAGGDDSSGIWFDTIHNLTKTNSIQGNTILNNGRSGISYEVSCNTDISHNFIKGNTGKAGSGSFTRGIMLRQSGPVNVHDNNVSMPASGTSYYVMEFEPGVRADSCSEGVNVKMYNNSITFVDTSSFGGFPIKYGNNVFDSTSESGMSICSGSACSGGGPNHFHDLSGGTIANNARYTWYSSPGNAPTNNFAAYQAASGQDATSTLDAVDGTAGITGCLHIACTGAGL